MRTTMTSTCLLLGFAGLTAFGAGHNHGGADPGTVSDRLQGGVRTEIVTPRQDAEAGGPPGGGTCFDPLSVSIPSVTPGSTLGFPISFVPSCDNNPIQSPGIWYEVTGTGTTITASLCSAVTDFPARMSVYCGDCEVLDDCCYNNGTPGCSTPGCEAMVCAADPFCCDSSWDDVCAGEAEDLCGSLCASTLLCVGYDDQGCAPELGAEVSWCSQPTARYLILVHGFGGGSFEMTVTQDFVPCAATVQCLPPPCAGDTNSDKDVDVNDLNNVIVGWGTDGSLGLDPATGQPVLADITDNFGGPPDGIVNVNDLNAVIVNWGPCLFAPGNDECPDKIDVTVLPNETQFVSLDMVAATPSTFGISGGCGNCNVPNGTPGCSGPNCEAIVCALDPFCCDTEWDIVCADGAVDLCGCSAPTCTPPAKDVWFCLNFQDDPAAGLGELVVSTTLDVFIEVYEGCDCVQPSVLKWCGPGLGGSDPIAVSDGSQCCVRVLNSNNLPNALLVGELVANVSRPCGPGTGDCCVNNGSPGCEDTACCETVCALDPFCCDTAWDGPCASAAIANCAVAVCGPCGNNASGDCCVSNGSPGCEDLDCCDTVCAIDPFCCDNTWDVNCAFEAITDCAGLCP